MQARVGRVARGRARAAVPGARARVPRRGLLRAGARAAARAISDGRWRDRRVDSMDLWMVQTGTWSALPTITALPLAFARL